MNTVTCPECGGARVIADFLTGLAIGAALGMGFFPLGKACPTCNGKGTVER